MRFVNQTRLLVESGMSGATGNIYVGLHEFEDMGFVLHALRPDDLFFDIGANIGSYTVLAAGGVGATCVSVEPVPSTYQWLLKNVGLNGLQERVTCWNVGVGEEQGVLRFTQGHGPCNKVLGEGQVTEDSVEVPVTTLDRLFEKVNIPGDETAVIVKVDTEGYEVPILQDSEIPFRNAPTAFILELDGSGSHYGFDESRIHQLLNKAGYKAVSYSPFQRQLHVISDKRREGNTVYVNDLDFFSRRVSNSARYSVINKYV